MEEVAAKNPVTSLIPSSEFVRQGTFPETKWRGRFWLVDAGAHGHRSPRIILILSDRAPIAKTDPQIESRRTIPSAKVAIAGRSIQAIRERLASDLENGDPGRDQPVPL